MNKVKATQFGSTRSRAKGLTNAQREAVKRLMTADKESFHINNVSSQDVTSTVAFIQLTAIAQGDSYNERVGDAASLKSLKSNIILVRDDNATADTYDNVRLITFIWHPDTANETPNSALDIIEQTTYPYLSALIKDKALRSKFTLLDDRWVTLAPREGGDPKASYAKIKIRKKLKKNIYFNPGVTTGRNHVYHMVIGENSSGANNSQMFYDSMVTFKQK